MVTGRPNPSPDFWSALGVEAPLLCGSLILYNTCLLSGLLSKGRQLRGNQNTLWALCSPAAPTYWLLPRLLNMMTFLSCFFHFFIFILPGSPEAWVRWAVLKPANGYIIHLVECKMEIQALFQKVLRVQNSNNRTFSWQARGSVQLQRSCAWEAGPEWDTEAFSQNYPSAKPGVLLKKS